MSKAKGSFAPPLRTPTYRKTTISKVYRDINAALQSQTDPFENYEIEFDDINRFEVFYPIGRGKYSIVFLGRADSKDICAIKTLKNVPVVKIQREISILNRVSTVVNSIHLIAVVKDPLTSTISIVTDYLQSEPARGLFPKLAIDDIRHLMYQLLLSLDDSHSKGIMHRDIKPGNLLVCSDRRNLRVIDWGLADLYFPGKAYTTRVSTMCYKAPELLLNYQYYDYGVDVWGAGVVLAEMLLKVPFFEGSTIDEMIAQVAGVCGTSAVLQYVDKYGLTLSQEAYSLLPPNQAPSWSKVVHQIKPSKYDEDCIKLLKQLLTVDHEERISAKEALASRFFDPVRSE